MSSAKAWGIPAEIVDPAHVKEKVPFLEEDVIIGAAWFPTVGVVDSLRAGTIMRERAIESGALTVVPNVEVTGMVVQEGRIKAVETKPGHHRGRDGRHLAAGCGAPRSPGWPAPTSRSPRPCTR